MLLRLLLIFVGVCAFGVLDAIVKGHHGGMRNVIGNISAPWAILPILAGSIAVPRRLAVGALAGVASTVAALASYALARGESLRLSQSGGATLATISPIGNRWFLLGLVGGIALGASGSWFARRQRWGAVVVVVAGLLVLEPAARVLWAVMRGDAVSTFVPYRVVWGIEVLCGCASLLGYRFQRRWSRPSRRTR